MKRSNISMYDVYPDLTLDSWHISTSYPEKFCVFEPHKTHIKLHSSRIGSQSGFHHSHVIPVIRPQKSNNIPQFDGILPKSLTHGRKGPFGRIPSNYCGTFWLNGLVKLTMKLWHGWLIDDRFQNAMQWYLMIWSRPPLINIKWYIEIWPLIRNQGHYFYSIRRHMRPWVLLSNCSGKDLGSGEF